MLQTLARIVEQSVVRCRNEQHHLSPVAAVLHTGSRDGGVVTVSAERERVVSRPAGVLPSTLSSDPARYERNPLVIAAGLGYRAPALVGLGLSVAGFAVLVLSAMVHRGNRVSTKSRQLGTRV